MRHNVRCNLSTVLSVMLVGSLAACADRSDAEYQIDIATKMHESIAYDISEMAKAARNLQAASPSLAWSQLPGDPAVTRMREAWKRTRIAWEHIEGAIAPMFAGLNVTMDARYEDFLIALGAKGDPNPFDANGVIGMHAIERILFAPEIRPEVVAHESSLPGYRAAAFPATDNEAIAFKTQLVQRLIDDIAVLGSELKPDQIDVGAAYVGMVGVMSEQREKLDLAVTAEEESRYANITLFDMRNNLDGVQNAYGLFREWIHSKAVAGTSDQQILDHFITLNDAYYTNNGDSLPQVPDGWSSVDPSPEVLQTPFGTLWLQIRESVDPESNGSMVHEMNRIAGVLGLPEFVE